MNTEDFYKIVDAELSEIIEKYKDDEHLLKNQSEINKQKSYALLIWFLNFYGKISDYSNYITDGDEDSSCDIVFDSTDNQGQKVFYIVQSKWNIISNCSKEVEKKDILQAVSDFDTILRGKKEKVNDKLKQKLEELQVHLKANGEVKFIYLTLCNSNPKANENIDSFLSNHRKTKFEFYDINRIKVDYIDRKYKHIDPENPLENHYNPEESKITIELHKLNNPSNYIRIEKPFEAYVFLIKPKTIFNLFEKYGFSLFFKNVRNPLIISDFNKEIEKTAIDNPAYFWYYNNGITAISYLIPEIRDQATTIDITGLQIINGAQTVYSVYKAYKEATPTKREIIDSEALITLRLLKSGGRDFDLNVTRFTNSQNPVNERDFRANDDIQIALQNQFYATNFWYEKRRGEFREIPKGVVRVSNIVLANYYMAYHLQDPVSVLSNFKQSKQSRKDLLFVSHKDNKEGLYEKVFSTTAKHTDFLTPYYLMTVLIRKYSSTKRFGFNDTFNSSLYHLLSLFKIIFTKYCIAKFGDEVNVDFQIQRLFKSKDIEVIQKTFEYINRYLYVVLIQHQDNKSYEKYVGFMTVKSQYERVKGELEEIDVTIEDIENMELSDEDVLFDFINEEEAQDGFLL